MLYDPTGLRRMADQCRSMASTRQTEELRRIFLAMAERYDCEAAVREAGTLELRNGTRELPA
jgi:hypothetical protein